MFSCTKRACKNSDGGITHKHGSKNEGFSVYFGHGVPAYFMSIPSSVRLLDLCPLMGRHFQWLQEWHFSRGDLTA